MAAPREAIFAALFDRLRAVPGIAFASRQFQGWTAAHNADRPALYLVKQDERTLQEKGKPPRWLLAAAVILVVSNDAAGPPPSSVLNDLISAIEGALARQPSEPVLGTSLQAVPDLETTTLGGLCSHCWISGNVAIEEGTIGGEAIAVIPIEILTLA